jgi:hypothetical protein
MENKGLIGLTIFIVLMVAGFFVWDTFLKGSLTVEEDGLITVEPKTFTYSSSTLGISVTYPEGYTVDESYTYEFSDAKVIHGVKFIIPGEFATGTNLSTDSGIALEYLPRAKNCTGDIYLIANVSAYDLTERGIDYSIATSSGAAAGNMYEEEIYALATSSPCMAFRYFIHSGNIGNYEPGAVRPFDKVKLLSDFDAIRQSLTFGVEKGTSTTTTIPQ